MKFQVTKGETSVILTVFIQDSSSTTGAGLGSLDESSSIVGGYVQRDSVGIALAVDEDVDTEGTYQAPSTAAQVRIGTPANMITGTYELHFHNDLFFAFDWVTITLSGAANMAPLTLEIQLINQPINDATMWDGLQRMYDGVAGNTDPTAPASRSQVDSIGAASGGEVNINATFDNTTTDTIDNAAADLKGGGLVGIPVTGHAFSAGREVTIAGSVAYNGSFEIVSQTANEVVITHSQDAEAFTGAETIISTVKTVPFVGSVQSGTFAVIEAADEVYHDIDDTGDTIDVIYGYNVGGSKTATNVNFLGFIQGNNQEVQIKVYDHVGDAWDEIESIPGQNGTLNLTRFAPLLLKHTGTGTDLGDVYIRLVNDATTPSNVSTDRLLVSAVNIGQSIGYANGQVWVNTINGIAGTEAYVNGVADKAVLTWADALVISAAVSDSDDYHIINGSTISLTANSDKHSLFGDNWVLQLNSQSIAGAHFQGASVSGIATASAEVKFEGCDVGTASIQLGHFDFCSFGGTVTHTLAGNYNYHNCYSEVAGSGAPTFDKTAGQAVTVQYRNWAGGIIFDGLEVGDTITVGGTLGTVDLGSPASAVAVEIRGTYKEVINVGAAAVNLSGAILAADVAAILADSNELQLVLSAGILARTNNPTLEALLGVDDDAAEDTVPFQTWDVVISKMLHDIAGSAAKILRQSGDISQIDGAVDDVAPAKTGFDTTLTQVDTFFEDALLVFTNGAANAGIGQPIVTYLQANGALTFVAPDDWPVTPVNGDDFTIYGTHTHPVSQINAAILALLPAALINGRMDSDVEAINDSTTAAGNLRQSALAMQTTSVQSAEAATNTDTVFDTALSLENPDYYGSADGGLVVAFINGTTNQFQTRRIVASLTGTLNTRITLEEALNAVPSDGDVMVILGRITELT